MTYRRTSDKFTQTKRFIAKLWSALPKNLRAVRPLPIHFYPVRKIKKEKDLSKSPPSRLQKRNIIKLFIYIMISKNICMEISYHRSLRTSNDDNLYTNYTTIKLIGT